MKSWRVELTCDAETLGEVPIKRKFFERDSLSSLLYLEQQINGMNFELERR